MDQFVNLFVIFELDFPYVIFSSYVVGVKMIFFIIGHHIEMASVVVVKPCRNLSVRNENENV
ncbi:hypothetical protein M5K25_016082 [Dendrobium thyrsiflorum]|uniref:Transmembrane protein n=1 Tax=Dendrobium thyrsiflorum TaxID=117978 RepID=A0ABD0US12_DENTH